MSLGLTPTDVLVDGRFPAWLFPAEATAAPTTTMAIAVHGQKVVLDAPMLSLGATVENAASTAMPITGGAVPPPVIWAAEQLTTVRYGVDWAAVDYLDDTSWVTVPTLVLHGTADPRVPVAVSEELAAAEPELVRLVTIADALHVEAWNVDPDRWSQEVVEFLS